MKTKQMLLSTFTMLLLLPAVVTAQENMQLLRFEDALQIMEDNNPALHQAKQQIKQKEYELKSKRGLYMPQIALSAKAVSMSETIHLDLTPVSDAITPLYHTLGTYGVFSGVPNPDPSTNTQMPFLPDDISTQVVREQLLEAGDEIAAAEWNQVIQEKNFASLTADFIWPIYTGGKIRGANKAAGVEVQMSQQELRQVEGVLLTELVSRYYGLALGIQVAEVKKQMLDAIENHYSNAQKLFDNGMIAKVELLHASVSRNEAEREYKESLRNIEIIRSGLTATLAMDSLVYIQPASMLFINNEINEISYWIAKANTYNPQLKQIEGKKQLVDIKNKVTKGSYLPTVTMLGSYNIAEKDLSPYLPDYTVGVGMKWTVFNGLSRRNKIKVGNTMQKQVEYAEHKALLDLEAYLTKLYQQLQMQMEQKDELETTSELAQEYSISTEKAFNEGFATSATVVDAYTKVAQVKAMRLKVLYDYDVTLAHFLQTSGIPEQYSNYCHGENTVTESLNDQKKNN